jgi:hypothetical protein
MSSTGQLLTDFIKEIEGTKNGLTSSYTQTDIPLGCRTVCVGRDATSQTGPALQAKCVDSSTQTDWATSTGEMILFEVRNVRDATEEIRRCVKRPHTMSDSSDSEKEEKEEEEIPLVKNKRLKSNNGNPETNVNHETNGNPDTELEKYNMATLNIYQVVGREKGKGNKRRKLEDIRMWMNKELKETILSSDMNEDTIRRTEKGPYRFPNNKYCHIKNCRNTACFRNHSCAECHFHMKEEFEHVYSAEDCPIYKIMKHILEQKNLQ